MNFWKQTTHVMSYFPEENFRGHERLPKTFMQGFLEVSPDITTELLFQWAKTWSLTAVSTIGSQLERKWVSIPCTVHSQRARKNSDFPLEPSPVVCAPNAYPMQLREIRPLVFFIERGPPPDEKCPYSCIAVSFSALNSSRAFQNFSETTSQRSSRSWRPFSSAAVAVVVSSVRVSVFYMWRNEVISRFLSRSLPYVWIRMFILASEG